MGLNEKVAIITGAVGDIGKANALALAKEGAKVVINDIKKRGEEGKIIVEEIKKSGGVAIYIPADISIFSEVESMVRQVLNEWGRIDILVNNAGVNRDALVIEMNEKAWEDVIKTNIGGVFNCTKAVIKPMMLNRKGNIINISSLVAEIGVRGQSNYSASKGAINSFTRAMAIELARFGIRVNAVAPGFIATKMTERIRKTKGDQLLALIPLRRFGMPEDVAKVVVFLASEDSNYITGEIIHITGGLGISLNF